MKNNPVGWFEIYVQNMDRARKFYEEIFDVKLEKLNADIEMWGFPMDMETTGASGALVKMPDYPSGGNSILIYFSSKDCAVEEAKVEDAGGKIERPKMSIGEYGFVTLAYDTEGNMFGLHSQE